MLLPKATVRSVVEAFGKRHNSSVMPAFPPNLPGACSNGELRTRTGQHASNTPVTPHPQRSSHGFGSLRRCCCKRASDRAGCFTFEEFGVGSEAERFQNVGLHLLCEGVDLVDTDTLGANHIAQLLLSRGSLNNPQNGVRDFLSVAGRGGKCRVDLCGDLLDSAIRIGASLVGARQVIAENRSLILAGIDNHGFNSLPGKFVAVRPPGSRIVAKTVCPLRASVSVNSLPKPVLEPVIKTTCLELMIIPLLWAYSEPV